MEDIYSSFGAFIKVKRNEKGLTVRGFAKEIGISSTYITDIENGRRNPPELAVLEKISNALLLSKEDETTMFELAGDFRNTAAPDLPEYIKDKSYVKVALRTARDLDANEEDWLRFVDELKKKKEGK